MITLHVKSQFPKPEASVLKQYTGVVSCLWLGVSCFFLSILFVFGGHSSGPEPRALSVLAKCADSLPHPSLNTQIGAVFLHHKRVGPLGATGDHLRPFLFPSESPSLSSI